MVATFESVFYLLFYIYFFQIWRILDVIVGTTKIFALQQKSENVPVITFFLTHSRHSRPDRESSLLFSKVDSRFCGNDVSKQKVYFLVSKNVWRSIFVSGTLKNKVSSIVTISIDPNPLNTLVPIEKSTNAIKPVLI